MKEVGGGTKGRREELKGEELMVGEGTNGRWKELRVGGTKRREELMVGGGTKGKEGTKGGRN